MTEKERIVNMLHCLGIPSGLLGEKYLIDAVLLCREDGSYINHMTGRLYPAVAELNSTTASRAEKAIRHAIEAGWRRGDHAAQDKYFGSSANTESGRPTNTEFIATLTERLEMEEADDETV